MKMLTRKLLSIFFAVLIPLLGFSQKEEVKFVVGMEASYIYFSSKPEARHGTKNNYGYGLNIAYPFRKFSIGLGVMKKHYGQFRFREITNDYETIRTRENEETDVYYYKVGQQKMNYLVLSNRLQYRLPCNCIFAHLGYNVEFLESKPIFDGEKYINLYGYDPGIYRESSMRKDPILKNVLTSVEIGLGFKVHIREQLRIVMRQTYTIANSFSEDSDKPFFKDDLKYLQVSLGVQYGVK